MEPRVRVLTALINGFKQAASPDSDAGAASVTAPLRALRGVSFVTGTNSGGEAGRGYRFQVSTDGRVEEELLVYSRALMLNSQDFSRLGLSGILLMLSSKKAAAVSADNEARRALLGLVLGYQLSNAPTLFQSRTTNPPLPLYDRRECSAVEELGGTD